MNSWEQKFKEGHIEVQFREDDKAMFYALKDGDNIYATRILVKENKEVIAIYNKEFDGDINLIEYNKFVKNFLEQPEMRTEYLEEGFENWDGVIQYRNNDGVNKKCSEKIRKLNNRSNKKLKFKDFVELKTFGRDAFSSMKLDKLKELVSKKDLLQIEEEFEDEKQILTALRWVARGLYVDKSIRKVKTDIELQKNKRF